jgi:hypothetical protein
MLLTLCAFILILSFWISIGLTEGWHWRLSSKKQDNNKLINDGNYHIWRLITNASIVLIPMVSFATPILFLIVANIFAWMCYERFMGFAENDKFFQQRPPFRLLGKEYKRPSMLIQNIILVISFIATIASMFF